MQILGLLHAAQAGHHTQCFNEISTAAHLTAAIFACFHERILADASYDCTCITLSYSWPSWKCHPCPPLKQSLPGTATPLINRPQVDVLACCTIEFGPFVQSSFLHSFVTQLCTPICAITNSISTLSFVPVLQNTTFKKNRFCNTHPKGMNWPGGSHC